MGTRGGRSRRAQVSSGGPWEARVGYSRAVRVDDLVFVSGCTAANPDGSIGAPGEVYGQSLAAYSVLDRAVRDLGGSLADVVRVRVYLTDPGRWEEWARAHHERLGQVRPAATLVGGVRFLHPDILVEVEADAVLRPRSPTRNDAR